MLGKRHLHTYSERQKQNMHERRAHTQNPVHGCENNRFSTKRSVPHVLAHFYAVHCISLPWSVVCLPGEAKFHPGAGVVT